MARHEVLRTVFQTDGDQPHQVNSINNRLRWNASTSRRCLLLSASRPWRNRCKPSRRAVRFAPRPLLRASLFALADEEFVLVVSMHHIVSDGWSMDVMVKEFVQCYQAFSLEREPQLPALALQYADYAIWQRRWLEAGEDERQLDYWRQQLGEEHPLLEVAPDFARPLTQSFEGQT